MECNKDEASRAKEIAERKVTEKDYKGAKKFALKAQSLYPQLDGLSQVLVTIDVYISAENKICGDADWYGILGVDPYADDESVRKQYRKLALMLHPDKNKCKGAEGAFKLVSEAWGLLSDKSKRLAYNQRRSLKDVQPRYPAQSGIPSRQPTSNGFQNVRNNVASSARARTKGNAHVSSSSFVSSNQKTSTFWTMCNRCRTQYEYLRIYLNQTLLCPNCQVAFIATEKAPPPTVLRPPNLSSHQQHPSAKHQAADKNTYNTSGRDSSHHHHPSVSQNFRWDSLSRMAGINSGKAQAQAASVVRQAHERVKRGFEESQEHDAARRMANPALQGDRIFKKSRPDDTDMDSSCAGSWANQPSVGTGARFTGSSDHPVKGSTNVPNTSVSAGFSNTFHRVLFTEDIRKALKSKACSEISKKFQELISETKDEEKKTEREKKGSKVSSEGNESEKNSRSPDIEDVVHVPGVENDEPVTIVVPDSDFHNFDLDRSEKSFEEDQIWAAYDDDDGMPRFYARIQKVVSLDPFKMRISWLNSRSNSELGDVDWIDSGFTKTCGDFRTGKYEFTDTLNSFSHRVHFTKGSRGVIRIFPRKGDVWALYRNWSSDWDSDTPDDIIHKYDMVEVLDGYTDNEQSVTVTLLVKVPGFRAVFRKSMDPNDARKIPKEEMFRFSHQVPNYVLTGQEADNAPTGCRELDPAATPVEFLAENTEVKESEAMENGTTPDP
ncbi:PREDICTED: uncharacterized protein LOC104825135 [Tarenaya hassleriana]|uniref:uncharacterized protein LOC104825135 n=1 Tax=Tarenaya hassleriana TaxID=28532 RepID=UPI00053C73A9|nr:PREDICTED: uncharacterized protein LOC104825135 [Tarenaya hassleriana]